MYPGSFMAGILPDYFIDLFGLSLPENGLTAEYASGGYTYWTDFLFQAMFAATAATIVSGAVAERIKLGSFMIFTIVYVGLVYPIAGSWKWGAGWLDELGFYDFAGSTLVHSVGGWAALVAVWLLGARIGKFKKDGSVGVIPGHNIPLATAGVFLLWLGWFGFNGGSVLSADPANTSLVLVTTCIAAASGGLSAFLVSLFKYKQYDLSMYLNGILGGLVGITAGADLMSVTDAMVIGFIAGALIVLGVAIIDKLKLDDPVGAIAVHLICGIWGTLAVGIFGDLAGWEQLGKQAIGVVSIGAFCLISAYAIIKTLKSTVGIRVSEEEEQEGLDIHEHGMDAYPDFGLNQH
jgi:Amt family ammonium transporter